MAMGESSGGESSGGGFGSWVGKRWQGVSLVAVGMEAGWEGGPAHQRQAPVER